MSYQSRSSLLWGLFEAGLQDCEQKTKVVLTEYSLTKQLQNCHSVGSITALLQGQNRTFGEVRGRDRIMKSIKSTVSVLCRFSAMATLGDGTGLVRRKALIGVSHVSDIRFTECQTCGGNACWPCCSSLCTCLR